MSLEILRRLKALERAVEILRTRDSGGRWVDWTPTVTQGGTVTVTVTEAKYKIKDGNECIIYAKLAVTANAGSAPNDIIIGGQPTIAQPAVTAIDAGVGMVMDSGTAYYRGIINVNNVTDFRLIDTNTRVQIGTNPNFALANGDTITFTATYRVA